MEIVTQILKHLPAGWPRIIALVGLGMLFFFPEMRRLLTQRHHDKEKLTEPIVWVDRLKFSMIGSFSLMLLGSIALWHSGKFLGGNVVEAILIELGLTVICGFIASAIPCRSHWECVFRGFLLPAFLGALAVAAKGNT